MGHTQPLEKRYGIRQTIVTDVWREYDQGLTGKPSNRKLEEDYGQSISGYYDNAITQTLIDIGANAE